MGTYSQRFDDEAVQAKAWELAELDGNDDPERMTYESDGGVLYPYGPVWSRYINDAIDALEGAPDRA